MYFWTTIRKNRAKYNLTRGISEDDICSILLHDVIVGKDPQKAEFSLLQLGGIKKYFNLLKTEREKEDFRRHMRKYINMWLPDCPFEVSTTNRYTIVTQEASTTARRSIKQGDTIKYLCGNLVAMTPEEEKDLDLTRRDFSIVMSSRKKTPSLFLGPARFSNHDCNANARLVTRGSDGMQVFAVRNIQIGEEITVNYGENYFGDGNCECLCGTCEAEGRGGWPGSSSSAISSGLSTPTTISDQDFDMTEPCISSRKRKSDTDSDLSAGSMSSGDDEGSPIKKRKSVTGKAINAFGIEPIGDLVQSRALKGAKPRSPLRQVLNVTDIVIPAEGGDEDTVQKLSLKNAGQHGKITQGHDDMLAAVRAAFAGATTTKPQSRRAKRKGKRASQKSHPSARSYGDSKLPYKPNSPLAFLAGITSVNSSGRGRQNYLSARARRSPLHSRHQSVQSSILSSFQGSSSVSEKDSTFDDRLRTDSSSATTPSAGLEGGIDWNLPPRLAFSPSGSSLTSLSSPLSSLPSIAEIDDDDEPTLSNIHSDMRNRGRPLQISRMVPLYAKPKAVSRTPKKIRSLHSTIELDIPSTRTPGDYIRTHLLLGESFSRWVDCRTCSACWVQANGYQTRKECPRCERHSKIYGYQWPKTDKSGKFDDEERVMDHRTVHRFIPPEEEKEERKRGRGVTAVDGMGSERDDSVGDDFESERTDSRVRGGGGGNGRTRGVGPAVYTR